ncbi:MCP four helix bundle domain-containing protein [Selenomonas sp.]|uniref:MCP four helix bundle domain-containing protein n=1 Tax=Selenomonas sp. TaxID=2053611 RepID=UPI00260120EC|nr:MCP four helix bundle domain-containing protein [Selenomonas sp.]MCI6284880.1 MCP four helix bundle domain-containing protein [Selenomonas sp.]
MMDHLTIRQKLYAVFGALLVIFACVCLYSGYTLYAINNNAMRIATQHVKSVLALSQTTRALAVYRKAEYAMAGATTLSAQIYASQQMRGLAQ